MVTKTFHSKKQKIIMKKKINRWLMRWALKILIANLRADKRENPPSYYYAWQSNIAMAFFDAYTSEEDLHTVANRAAKNFLENLIRHYRSIS